MEIIDKSKVSNQERENRKINEVLGELVKDKETARYTPSQDDVDYLKSLRNNLFNRQGKSKTQGLAVIATFPLEVHLEMSKLHGPRWQEDAAILDKFLKQNPMYCMGKPEGFGEKIIVKSDNGGNHASV